MTHSPSRPSEDEEIEVTAAYGTAVATTGAPSHGNRDHQPKPHGEAGESGTGDSDVAGDGE